MSKTLKVWNWTLIAVSAITVIMLFIFMEGMLGLLYAAINLVAALAIVRTFKLDIRGAYVFLGMRIIETLITFCFSAAVIKACVFGIEVLSSMNVNYIVFGIVVAVLRLVSAVVSTIFYIKA